MINPRSAKVRIVYIAVAAIALLIFAISHKSPTKAGADSAFENFVGELEPKLENPALTGTPFSPLAIEFDAPSRGIHFNLMLKPDSTQPESARIGRILQMAHEANLFGLPVKNPAEIRFLVQSEKKTFNAAFNVSDIENNPQAQAMLKLLEIYASSPPPAPSPTVPELLKEPASPDQLDAK